jgi:hypothetical protein
MDIDRATFAQECIRKCRGSDVDPHYMLGVAQLRSGISDGSDAGKVGPFRLTQEEWDANSNDDEQGIHFTPAQISSWQRQCTIFALMTHRAIDAFVSTNHRNPSPKELYLQQTPTAATATFPAEFQKALDDTADLLGPAAEAVDPTQTVAPITNVDGSTIDIEKIIHIATNSKAFKGWNNGTAPAGYIKGMALVFARVLGKLQARDPTAIEMAKANTGNESRDALAWYNDKFSALGMKNDVDGPDTLRHLFVLLVGVGMRESNGRYCEGRDRSAHNVTADRAEAGLFQTSFNAADASPLLRPLFEQFKANPSGFKDVFQEGVTVKSSDLENFGSGEGMEFQRLTKDCPGFAAEFAAVGFRNIRTHWGTINRKEAEVRPECDAMFLAVQNAVKASTSISQAIA